MRFASSRASTAFWARLPPMAGVIGYVRAQIGEIERGPALRWDGGAMAVLHVVPFLYWASQSVAAFLNAGSEPICWPLVPECGALRVLSADGITLVLRAYFAAAGGTGVRVAARPRGA